MYMYTLDADLSQKKEDMVTPFVLINLSTKENLRLKKNTVVAFTKKDETEGELFELETLNITPLHWVPRQAGQTFTLIASLDMDSDLRKIDTETDLHKVLHQQQTL